MSDLIDREEAKRLLFEMGKEKAALALDEVPTISCEECKSLDKRRQNYGICDICYCGDEFERKP